jgi:hypothetical protein
MTPKTRTEGDDAVVREHIAIECGFSAAVHHEPCSTCAASREGRLVIGR